MTRRHLLATGHGVEVDPLPAWVATALERAAFAETVGWTPPEWRGDSLLDAAENAGLVLFDCEGALSFTPTGRRLYEAHSGSQGV